MAEWDSGDWKSIEMAAWNAEDHSSKFLWENGQRHITLSPKGTDVPVFPMQFRGQPLGHTSKACVFPVVAPPPIYEDKASGREFKWRLACKQIDCENARMNIEDAREEAKTMAPLRHPHIVSYVASYDSEDRFGIIMYPATPQNLKKYMNTLSEAIERQENAQAYGPLDENLERRRSSLFGFPGCLSQALSYLHRTQRDSPNDPEVWGVKHKDVKPDNILVDDFDSPLLTDFGIAHRFLPQKETIQSIGATKRTEKYAPPEAFDSNIRREEYKYDIFSLACVLLEIATVALGVSLKQMHKHRAPYDQDKPYADTIDASKTWLCDKLPAEARARAKYAEGARVDMVERGIAVLPTITKMMSKAQGERPYAYELWEDFQQLYTTPKWTAPCPHCIHQHIQRESDSRGAVPRSAQQINGRMSPSPRLPSPVNRRSDTGSLRPKAMIPRVEAQDFDEADRQVDPGEVLTNNQPTAQPTAAAPRRSTQAMNGETNRLLTVPGERHEHHAIEDVSSRSEESPTIRPVEQRKSPEFFGHSGPRVILLDSETQRMSIVRTSQFNDSETTAYPFPWPWQGWLRVTNDNGAPLVSVRVSKVPRARDRLRIMLGRINKVYIREPEAAEGPETATEPPPD